MSDCCTPQGYRLLFSESRARTEARRYRRRGLDRVSKRVVDLVRGRGVDGASLLEVGGGIGAVQIELLKAGAAGATSVELTPTYESEAASLLGETGLRDRVERRILDFAERGGEVGSADVVVLNRVLCCYHDMPRLAGTAAAHARRLLVLTFPKERGWTRALVATANLAFWLTRRQFHLFLHSPARIRATAEQHGLRQVCDQPGFFWQLAAFEREQPARNPGSAT